MMRPPMAIPRLDPMHIRLLDEGSVKMSLKERDSSVKAQNLKLNHRPTISMSSDPFETSVTFKLDKILILRYIIDPHHPCVVDPLVR
jgi:hypothetical protein